MREDKASSTASLIAASTIFLQRDPRASPLVHADAAAACEIFLTSAAPRAAYLVKLISNRWLRWAGRLAERLTVPGLPLHFILRKRFIEEAVAAGLADGFRQVVILGAGFDTLALRLHADHAAVSFIELDHPATQRCKRDALLERGECGDNLAFIPADFTRHTLHEILFADARYDADLPTLVVMEGVLMYLSDDQVAALFSALGAHLRAPGRVVFTVMEPLPNGRLDFHNATMLATGLLRLWREPFKSGLARAAIAGFLARHHFVLRQVADHGLLRERHLSAPGRNEIALARGELICVADRAQG